MQRLGVAPKRIHVVSNGFDQRHFYPSRSDARDPQAPFRLLVVSRLVPGKDPLTMAHAVSILARSGVKVALTLIGRGPLRDRVAEVLADAPASVRYVDQVPQPALGAYYRAGDALVLTQRVSGSNQSILEAMACGLPIIASDLSGIRENVGTAGVLVPPGDAAAVARAVMSLAENPVRHHALREVAARRAREFTWAAVAQKVRVIYDDVIATASRPPERSP
jgi:glycosyltransferase involved in cell wall biosynthesis